MPAVQKPHSDVIFLSITDTKTLILPTPESYLSPDDLKRLKTLKNTAKRQSFLTGRYLLTRALKHFAGNDNYQLSFNNNGKPVLKNQLFSFNLSHSKDIVAIAIYPSKTPEEALLGLDIEVIRPHAFEKLSKAYFQAEEINTLKTSTPAEAQLLFWRLWSLKEAKIKALGSRVLNVKHLPEIKILDEEVLQKYNLNNINIYCQSLMNHASDLTTIDLPPLVISLAFHKPFQHEWIQLI